MVGGMGRWRGWWYGPLAWLMVWAVCMVGGMGRLHGWWYGPLAWLVAWAVGVVGGMDRLHGWHGWWKGPSVCGLKSIIVANRKK